MNSAGVDLLVRVVAEQIGEMLCERCSKPLERARIALRDVKPDHVIVEAVCAECDQSALLQIKPESDGVARVT